LEDKGYRKPLQRNTPHFPVENLNVIGKLVNNVGSVHSNTFTVEINISFQTSLPSHAHETQTDIPSVYDKN
jgi:ribosomal protein L6P/L9E